MKIVTFYSFKGGVGRSTALANVGYLLANSGYKTACTDFDIEAPGLNYVFDVSPGVIKGYLQDYLIDEERYQTPTDFIKIFIDLKKELGYEFAEKNGSLKLLPAGICPDKNDKINVNLKMFQVVNNFYESVEEIIAPDFLLVDSRSGMSNLSLPAQMRSDAIIVMFRYGRQQLDGTYNTVEWLNRRYKEKKNQLLPIWLVACNIPLSERTEAKQREMRGLESDLQRMCKNDKINFITTVFSSDVLASGERVVANEPYLDVSLVNAYKMIAAKVASLIE